MIYDDRWTYSETPEQPGWYATIHCWDAYEGTFIRSTEWLGDRWAESFPFVAWQGPFPDEDAADAWARAHDPEAQT